MQQNTILNDALIQNILPNHIANFFLKPEHNNSKVRKIITNNLICQMC